MKFSRLCYSPLRENPADAEVVSHQWLVRAGFIRRLASGIYSYMPLMWRVLQKIETIIRQEMDATGAQELRMPILQPADIWQKSGRWDVYGKELIRLKDRHQRDCVLGPTHEEVITSLAQSELRSYRKLPMNLYQMQNKYRDEIRPRFGLLRGREFIMKDAYSFHQTQACLEKEYDVMAEAYKRIFERCGLETKMIRSDSGAIGGSVSHEFVVLTQPTENGQESGEVDVFYCDECDYSANSNQAESILPPANTTGDWATPTMIETPHATTIEIMAQKFNMRPETIVKCLVVVVNEETPVLVLIRGDLEAEEVKLQNAITAHITPAYDVRMATEAELKEWFGSSKGFIGPVNLPKAYPILADESIRELRQFCLAVNVPQWHLVGAQWGDNRIAETTYHAHSPTAWADIRCVREGDFCVTAPDKPLKKSRGIEVGNIFQLGTKYSQAMEATFADEDGTEKPFIMGCYGIGVSRTAASAIEQYYDANGMCWPLAIAPYHAVVVPVNVNDAVQGPLAVQLYEQLRQAGVDVVLDDRDERAGSKFKDADLIGFPYRITVGKKAADGLVELKGRTEAQALELTPADAVQAIIKAVAAL